MITIIIVIIITIMENNEDSKSNDSNSSNNDNNKDFSIDRSYDWSYFVFTQVFLKLAFYNYE